VQDAFGQMLRDAHAGLPAHEINERDDGFVAAGTIDYFAPVARWWTVERRALRFVRGRVLDVGSGAGRVATELAKRGHDVVGIDPSPGAIEVAHMRGVRDLRQMKFEDVDSSIGPIDTIVLFGNNFGLFEARTKTRRLLGTLRPLASRIVATSTDPYATDDPAHLAYHERNRRRHRMPGQLRLRVRYRDLIGPWFNYLLVSPSEMEELVSGTGWQIERLIRGGSARYVAVIT
jgi:SAM-dependent methyltransferase